MDKMSKFELFRCLGSNDANITVKDHNGNVVEGILQAVTREDGSGNNFNLMIRKSNGIVRTIFVRTY